MTATHATTRGAVRSRGNGGGVYTGNTLVGSGMMTRKAKTPRRAR